MNDFLRHKRVPIFRHDCPDALAGWKARHFRKGIILNQTL